MKEARIFILSLAIVQASLAQNLVPNPGFERYSKCPYTFSATPYDFGVVSWSSPSPGTPDYYNRCSIGDNSVPANWAGVSHAHSGVGYVGIYAWSNNTDSRSYREYVQGRLLKPLVKGGCYSIKFYYRLASYSVYAIDRIGLLLTDSLLTFKTDDVIGITPTMETVKNLNELTNGWQMAQSVYVANGDEQFVTIGNFSNNERTRSMKIGHREGKSPMLGGSAYYYIDDVSVELMDDAADDSVVLSNVPEIKVNETYILKNIHFEYDSYNIRSSSFNELDDLVRILKVHPDWKVEITGHTDDRGSEMYNLHLSRNRARSVGEYLSQNGVEVQRIFTQGFGKQKPLVDGSDEPARAKNRRVELKFLN